MQENELWQKSQLDLNKELERKLLENAHGYDPLLNERLKRDAYKAEIEWELEQKRKLKEIEQLMSE